MNQQQEISEKRDKKSKLMTKIRIIYLKRWPF